PSPTEQLWGGACALGEQSVARDLPQLEAIDGGNQVAILAKDPEPHFGAAGAIRRGVVRARRDRGFEPDCSRRRSKRRDAIDCDRYPNAVSGFGAWRLKREKTFVQQDGMQTVIRICAQRLRKRDARGRTTVCDPNMAVRLARGRACIRSGMGLDKF